MPILHEKRQMTPFPKDWKAQDVSMMNMAVCVVAQLFHNATSYVYAKNLSPDHDVGFMASIESATEAAASLWDEAIKHSVYGPLFQDVYSEEEGAKLKVIVLDYVRQILETIFANANNKERT